MTTLDAINIMAQAVGETPYTEVDTEDTDIATMLVAFNKVSTAIQMQGWSFNTETEVTLAVDTDGYVYPPTNALVVNSSATATDDLLLVQRGDRLYSRKLHTFKIDSEVLVDIIYLMDYEDIPVSCQLWIANQAAAEYSMNQISSEFQLKTLATVANDSKMQWINSEDKVQGYKYLNPRTNLHAAQLLNRGGRPTSFTNRPY